MSYRIKSPNQAAKAVDIPGVIGGNAVNRRLLIAKNPGDPVLRKQQQKKSYPDVDSFGGFNFADEPMAATWAPQKDLISEDKGNARLDIIKCKFDPYDFRKELYAPCDQCWPVVVTPFKEQDESCNDDIIHNVNITERFDKE